MTAAKSSFDNHIVQCDEAIKIYEFLDDKGYSANFGLRFVWVASVSALDHYISELVVERATEHFSNGSVLTNKLQREKILMSQALELKPLSPTESVVRFRSLILQMVSRRTFQKAKDVADGLSYIWGEAHKWDKIADELELQTDVAREKLNSIGIRRDKIVHSADYDLTLDCMTPCNQDDTQEALSYIVNLVTAIDVLVH